MESKFAFALLCCVLAGSYNAQAAPGKPQQINLEWNEGAEYFHFPEGAQLKVTALNCPPSAAVIVACKTATHAKCGSWHLGLNGTATAGPKGDMGVASINYNATSNDFCTATVTVQSP